MSNKVFKKIKPLMIDRWGSDFTECVFRQAEIRYAELCQENSSDSKAVKAHTEAKIFPCISLYEALMRQGIQADDAQSFLDWAWSECAKPGARLISALVHCFGLYNVYPSIFTYVAKNSFGTEAGFKSVFYDCGKKHSRFDMNQCIYSDTCKKYGYPELVVCFCHVDDINNENLHPRLCWNRTQCMGEGADYCDFDIFVINK